MKRFDLKLVGTVGAALALAGLLTTAQAFEPKVVTFDDGVDGWEPGGDCGTIMPDNGNPGAYWNVASRICGEPNSLILQGWSVLRDDTDRPSSATTRRSVRCASAST